MCDFNTVHFYLAVYWFLQKCLELIALSSKTWGTLGGINLLHLLDLLRFWSEGVSETSAPNWSR